MGKPVACEHHVQQTDFGKVEIFSTLTKKLYLKNPGAEKDVEKKKNKKKEKEKVVQKEPLEVNVITLENGEKTDFGLRTQRRAQLESAGKAFCIKGS